MFPASMDPSASILFLVLGMPFVVPGETMVGLDQSWLATYITHTLHYIGWVFTGLNHEAVLTVANDSIALKDECLETLVSCTRNSNGCAVQLLSGPYLELFKFIYLHQEMDSRPLKTDLDWGVFDCTNRVPERGGSGKMGNLLWYNDAKNKAFRYLTQCRAQIFDIHARGQCSTYKREVGKRVKQLKSPAHSEKDLRDIFKELQKLPASHWKRGRPAVFTVLEDGTSQGNDISSVRNPQSFNPLSDYEGDDGRS
jgi:hypothetical protein